ncbi:MAG: hypothetical protein ACE5HS_16260 [bacterium]
MKEVTSICKCCNFLCISLFILVQLFWTNCSKDITGTSANQPPETHLSVFLADSAAVVDTSSSQLVLHWWGDDADGLVIGFVYSFFGKPSLSDTLDARGLKGFTTALSDTFNVPVGPNDTTFTFYISAVDNEEAVDPTPAFQAFPVENSPPEIQFRLNSLPIDTTFPVVTFSWNATDIDGQQDLEFFEFAINPPVGSEIPWRRLAPEKSFVTLTPDSGLITDSDNRFLVRAADRGQAFSNILEYPGEGEIWYVKDKVGNLLFIDDFTSEDESVSRGFFKELFDAAGEAFSIYDLARNGLPASFLDFTETLKLFDKIVWWADGSPTLAASQQGIISYLGAGGHILLTGFEGAALQDRSQWIFNFRDAQDSLLTFLPIKAVSDTVGKEINRILQGTTFQTLSSSYPELSIAPGSGSLNLIGKIFGLYPKPDAVPLYQLPPASEVRGNLYNGQPIIGVKTADNSVVLLEFPLTKIDKSQAKELILRVFQNFSQ